MKRKMLLLAAVAWLGGCYLIGQYRYPHRGEQIAQVEQNQIEQNQVEQNQIEQNQTENDNQLAWSKFDIMFEGSKETSDNPWGYTAGIIDTDFAGECILLNPNTSVSLKPFDYLSSLNLSVKIHPWVAESSDGAGIDIWLMNDSDEILRKESLFVSNEDMWNDIIYTAQELDGVKKIKFLCNNGEREDDSADWIIIKDNNLF